MLVLLSTMPIPATGSQKCSEAKVQTHWTNMHTWFDTLLAEMKITIKLHDTRGKKVIGPLMPGKTILPKSKRRTSQTPEDDALVLNLFKTVAQILECLKWFKSIQYLCSGF